MALGHSPSIVRDGLVFYYDMGNTQKSWKGAPTINLYTDGDYSLKSLHPVRDGPWTFPAGEKDPNGNQAIKVTADGTTSYHGRDIAVTIGQTYSASCWIYVSLDCNSTLVRLTGEQGFPYNAAYNLSNKGTWQYVKVSGNATTTNARILAYQVSNMTTGYVLFGSMQFEQNSFATPFVNGTRSNTQAILDLTGSNTVTANSLTYNTDGSFSFNGTSSELISATNTSTQSPVITVEASVKMTGSNTMGFIIGNGTTGPNGYWISLGTSGLTFSIGNGTTGQQFNVGALSVNTIYHIIGTYDGTTIRVYVNGSLYNSTTAINGIINYTNVPQNFKIGNINGSGTSTGRWFYGDIYNARIYNRVLSPLEVKQNFEALRDRYGI